MPLQIVTRGSRISWQWLLPWLVFLPLLGAPSAFAFLYVDKGDPLPPLVFVEAGSGAIREFGPSQGPLILVFWGGDVDTKKERAMEVLAQLQKNRAFYRDRNIELAAVLVQPEQMPIIAEVVDRTGIDFPVYVDDSNHSFARLGVYVMPSLLIVNHEGIIHEALGYTRNLDELLPGEVQVMLHEKTRQELDALLHPAIVERSEAKRRARLDYHYALQLLQRRSFDLALEELDVALAKDPDFVPALLEKGCLLVRVKKFAEAAPVLARVLTLVPGLERAVACQEELATEAELERQGQAAPVQAPPAASWGLFADDDEDDGEAPLP
jgi:tetratricopeptide (TPR) repeat protein